MVSMFQRMRKLQSRLLSIRLGPGAAVLPVDVKRIHLRFAKKLEGGHMGPRKFSAENLPRLKYHNPAVAMTLDRGAAQTDAATLSIHFAAPPQISPATASPSSTNAQTDRVETITMTNKTSGEILDEFLRVTRAEAVEPTAEDREEMRSLEEQRRRSERDSKVSLEVRQRKKREEDILRQAKGEIPDSATS